MSTPFGSSISNFFRPTTTAPQNLQHADAQLQKLDTVVDVGSKLNDTFASTGMSKTVCSLLFNKLGVMPNMVATMKSYAEGDMSGVVGSGAKVIGAMGMGTYANMADGVGNAMDLGKGIVEGDASKAFFAGAKLTVNVAASGSAPALALLGVSQFTYQAIRANPEGFMQFNHDTHASMKFGFDENMGPGKWD
ncbi:hypothetical protein FXN63_02975 [Pigmentiphaga aceris]|uniref:Uncharacterized protein n=1 Tax=Pigmentiphaga aceris TaxID=1940612 RepID=A0A5C0AS07_9BURK|nr:hypothetical protein [Pigmentiphaga aceris]QEI04918.1 hypothetical protein FXN63_02975 [Pigmentiphaga aceris]